MTSNAVVAADRREAGRKSVNRSLRKKNRIPGILYGKTAGNQVVWIDGKQMEEQFRAHGEHALFQVAVGGRDSYKVMAKEVQRDPLQRGEILHVDLYQVDENLPIDTAVALEPEGESPGVQQGGVLQQQLRELDVRCLSDRVPERIKVPMDALQIGDTLYVKDLTVPPGVEVKNEPDALVATVLEARRQTSEEEQEAPAEEAESTEV